tara:strand:+ start:1047 stop:1487 length:441 start_codon:yes stop_codon:yes gene_type:complete
MKDNFDIHKWNFNRYLNENNLEEDTNDVDQEDIDGSLNITRGGDDAKMGAELESDANVVGEGLSDRISKINIDYTEQGRFYGVKVEDASGKRLGKLGQDDANGLLKMLNIEEKIPRRIEEKVLDSIVNQLQDQGIDAEWNDYIDVS